MRYYVYFSNGGVVELWRELPEKDFIELHASDKTVIKIVRKSDMEKVYEKKADT